MELQVINVSHPHWTEALQHLRHDFYHLPAYAAIEARRIQAIPEAVLIQEGEKILFLPYLLRRCNDLFPDNLSASETFDLISPYGYPGFLLNPIGLEDITFIQRAINHLVEQFKARAICAAFLRLHPILNQELPQLDPQPRVMQSETVAVDLNLTEAEIWHQTRPEHRNKINKLKRAGFSASLVSWQDYQDDFIEIYTETMDRVGASAAYYFNRDYFYQLGKALQEKLHLCIVQLDQQPACAGLFTECCGIVQYHLGGTRHSFLKQSPSTLMFDHIRYWAKARENQVFHLGGGVGGANDSLHHFKAGFSQQRHQFYSLCLILDPEKYRDLVTLQSKRLEIQPEQLLQTKFFPAYRASAVS